MKKKLFIYLLFLYFSLSSLAFSIEYVNSSKHWSLIKNGPVTIDQAVKMFFEGRKIDKYEGVWTESNWGIVAIVKDGPNKYQKYHQKNVKQYHLIDFTAPIVLRLSDFIKQK